MNVEKFFNAQCGEDIYIFENVKMPVKGVYVDIGSAHPVINSNTFWLDVMGWKGYCIEPDTEWHADYPLMRSERCRLLNIGAYSENKEMAFNVSPLHELSKLSHELGENNKVIKVNTLDKICLDNDIKNIDFLSIDVEGFEVEVLKGINFNKYKPIVIMVEYVTLGVRNNAIMEYFYNTPSLCNNYTPLTDSTFNHIFVKNGYVKF